MSVVSVRARDFILALFIRDDGQRFLLGDNGYDFKDSQLHFSANTIENDEVVKQGADGVMLAGQVRRASVQSFDGFIGDATMPKETIEQMRRDFFAFFAKGHHFRVVYVDTARNAWQRKGGYLVDAPEVKELYQIHPEYHVGLNFEDVSYYSYNENSDGDEILANTLAVPVSTDVNGGLEWDEDGAVSEPAVIEYDTETAEASGKSISISDAADAPLASFQLDGETSQNGTPTPSAPVAVNTTTGENVVEICGKNLAKVVDGVYEKNGITVVVSNGRITVDGTATANAYIPLATQADYYTLSLDGTYTFSGTQATGLSYAVYYGTSSILFSTGSTQTKSLSGVYPNARVQLTILSGSSFVNETVEPMIEKGSPATDFEPYQGQSYEVNLGNIELCKIGDYQDYIYKDGNDWKIRKAVGKYVYNNDLSSNGISATRVDMITPALPIAPNTSTQNIAVSNMYGSTITDNTGLGGTTALSLIRIITSRSIAASYDAVKALAAANNLTIYYALATPTDTEITNATLIAQLDALLNNARTYAGVNNIFTVTPSEQGTLEIGYYTKYDLKITAGGYVWEVGGEGGPTTVLNNSIDNVAPIWTVKGPTLNPTLENATTGEQIEYVGMIAEGQTLVIDMGEQTALLDGLNVISNVVGDYISLAPGANTLLYSVTGTADASEIGWSEIVG